MPEGKPEDNKLSQPEAADVVRLSKEAIVRWKLDGTITGWNPSAERIFGYTAEEMIEQSISKIIPKDDPDRLALTLEQVRQGKTIEDLDIRLSKNGGDIDISLTLSPIRDESQRVIGILGLGVDVSARNRLQTAERDQLFLASIVSTADDAIVSKNLQGIVTSWNGGAEKIFGYAADEMVGQPITKLMSPDHLNEEPQILARIRRGEQIEHYESERRRKDGRIIEVSLTISPIKDREGRIVGVSKIARDITASKRAEAREREILRQAQDARRLADEARQQAEAANKAKDEFLATISHELRTPITSILGWTRMLVIGQLTPERQQKAFETIDRNARSQAQLIEDLLDVSRIISGKLRVDFKIIDMAAGITAAVEALRPTAEAKRIHIVSAISSGAGPVVGDSERLQQVAWNLLSNAIKFTPRDGSIQIELRRVESQVEFRVTDNGIGINPSFLPYVFDRFSQADSSITRSRGGLGMGLSIVKSLVELHGGAVSVSSPGEGRGATFTVTLPVSVVQNDGTHWPAKEGPMPKGELKRGEDLLGLKILIVDDEPDTCDMLRFIFNECGSIVETVQSAHAALGVFDTWLPDMLISDIGMPDVDGYELIRVIREERQSRIPAVALTAMARIEDRLKALTAGFHMHVSKPVEPAELVTIVTSLVGLVNRRPET